MWCAVYIGQQFIKCSVYIVCLERAAEHADRLIVWIVLHYFLLNFSSHKAFFFQAKAIDMGWGEGYV